MNRFVSGVFLAAIAASTLSAAERTAAADNGVMRWQTMAQSSTDMVFTVAVTELLRTHLGYRAQITTGRPIVRQAMDAANQNVEFWTTASSVNHFMRNGIRMYEKTPDAPELFKNVRMILNYPLGAYHIVVWADSGIETLQDIKGKRVFLGPPGGAATVTAMQMVDGATGYEAGVDFSTANVDWNSGMQAFQDRQIDLYMAPMAIPDPAIVQLAMLGKIRILGLTEEALNEDSVKQAMSIPGRVVAEIPADLYGKNQVNDQPARTLQTIVGLGTHKWMDEETVYNVTKTIFENTAALQAEAEWMSVIAVENGLAEMNAPLHPGAYRYYRERGIAIPEALRPPEMKQ
ncbi:MAG: TAXI family TRAP transporter solute-binding subunit [Aquisalimonadaceae bacterium]